MNLTIIDSGKSIPTSFTQSISTPLVAYPNGNTLAQFGLSTNTGGIVQLQVTLGLQVTTGSPSVLISLIRDSTVIATSQSTLFTVNALETLDFAFVDSGMPAGYHSYTLLASISNDYSLNRANVVGPIIFTGLSLV
ncbi:hypothetical protein J2Z69_002222 [Paenibacillus shirakamiensis]|uniref:Exosporium leader peptide n=1 Tax=Paenibacillus shirakamiensis TaxID=1265935 RepID=A0ABS4JKP7_9BACL|nr:hypothetical protein [Paenibacillus shirakamiensis]MBP2001179.1 hypothetical protein [Paenibacillus shirakamiensis]